MGTIGPERSLPGILGRPPAYTPGSRATDGRPLDSRTMILALNEAAHLVHESTRHLGVMASAFVPTVHADKDGPWDAVPDLAKPPFDTGDYDLTQQIPWDQQSAVCFDGPHVIEDEASAEGDPLPRKVRFDVKYSTGPDVNGARVYFALTYDPSPRSVASCSVASGDFAKVDLGLNTTDWATAVLAPTVRAPDPRTKWRGRRSADDIAQTSVTPMYLWVGWRFIGTGNSGCLLRSFSVFEVR